MATAKPAEAEAPGSAGKGGKKKLLIIVGALVALLAIGGAGAAFFVMKQRAAAAEADVEEAEVDEAPARKSAVKRDAKKPPVFAALEPFTVNLADRQVDKFAQVSIALELDNEKSADRVKAFTPVIRNHLLLAMSRKTSAEMLDYSGKMRLALELHIETLRALGVEVPDELTEQLEAAVAESQSKAASAPEAPKPAAKKPKKKKKPKDAHDLGLPVIGVHFSNFIIQ